jgi:hypothetical protein
MIFSQYPACGAAAVRPFDKNHTVSAPCFALFGVMISCHHGLFFAIVFHV